MMIITIIMIIIDKIHIESYKSHKKINFIEIKI